MATSIFLARLIGPILMVIGVGMLVNAKVADNGILDRERQR